MKGNKFLKSIIIVFVMSIMASAISGNANIVVNADIEMKEGEIIFEAEDAILSDGLTVEDEEPGYSGTGYVANFDDNNQSLTFTIEEIPDDSLYDLTIGYASIHGGGKVANILLNEESFGTITMGDGFGEVSAGKVLLNKGTNTVTITPNWTWFAIDYIKISPSAAPPKHEVEKRLINPDATQETKAVFSYLVDNFGENILSGQQGDPRDNLADIDYIEELTGKLPAILGLDLMDYSPSRVEHGATAEDVERGIDWYKQGGIVTISWHWNAPKDLLNTDEQPWWSGFYTDATTFDIEYAMNHPESEDYKLLLRDIDVIAEELKKLQEAGDPVLWRPLHEAEGGWFWWGAKGPEPVKELWKLMYDRMTNEHQLDNLIWVWNSIDKDWYPGNEYVDIVSFDSYPGEFNYTPQSGEYEALVDLSNNQKIVAMAENGPIPDPDLLQLYSTNYLYFTTWNGLLDKQNSDEHIIKVYHHDNVITLEDLPDFKANIEVDPNEDEKLEIIENLKALVNKAKEFALDGYTEDSFDSLLIAIESAEEVLASGNLTGEQVEAALSNLQSAIEDLKEIKEEPEPTPEPDSKLDKSALERLIKNAQSYEADQYTNDSIEILRKALKKAESVLISEKATQDQIDVALVNLQSAVDDLIENEKAEIEDLLELEKPVENAEEENGIESESSPVEDNKLPKTATNNHNWIIAGLITLVLGSILLLRKKTKIN